MKSKTIDRVSKSTVPAEEISAILEESNSVLVVSHVDPDGDALGTQLAFATFLRKNGKDVFLVREDEIPEKYLFLPGLDEIKHIREYHNGIKADAAVILECPKLSRAGNIIQKLNEECRFINIDHHQDNEGFGEINWVDQQASSVGEMVGEYFDAVGYEIDPQSAMQLYTAILTDTGRFRYNSTSARTMEIAGKLIASGADPRIICDQIYYNLPLATIKLVGHALDRAEFVSDNKICILSLTKEDIRKKGARLSDTEGLAEYTLYGKGVELGILLKEGDDGVTRVSLRSRGKINVADLAAKFDGGGHACAAGCSIEKHLAEAKKIILKALTEMTNV